MNASVFLTRDQLRAKAPAIFAEDPSARLSNRYAIAKTIDVVDALEQVGWYPTHAVQALARKSSDPTRNDTNRHLIRFRNVDVKPILNECFPEIIIANSHDGTSQYVMHAGLFRLVCMNGMVIADSMFAARTFRHAPKPVDSIIEGTFEVVHEIPAIEDNVRKFNGLLLDAPKRQEFARRVTERVLNDWHVRSNGSKVEIDLEALIAPQRDEDKRPSLWNVYNTVQERVIKGGVNGTSATGRRTRSRGLWNPRANIFANKELWQVTSDFYDEVKAG